MQEWHKHVIFLPWYKVETPACFTSGVQCLQFMQRKRQSDKRFCWGWSPQGELWTRSGESKPTTGGWSAGCDMTKSIDRSGVSVGNVFFFSLQPKFRFWLRGSFTPKSNYCQGKSSIATEGFWRMQEIWLQIPGPCNSGEIQSHVPDCLVFAWHVMSRVAWSLELFI